ncbi:hypothetical protein FQN60_002421 [Etheostoma spectabile]|uniref:Phosphatidylinositol 5-phosphate 4-kinase type-2 gamma n=1 Tax=Etheostoma spectabile TaxID=54343 RepID=A0A5J5D9Y9_9PERO|nr:hypothetical protein FQN60_002421 [Etheostoma spectabile]
MEPESKRVIENKFHQEEVSTPAPRDEESPFVVMAALGNSGAASSPMVVLAPKTKTKKKHFVQQKVKVFRASDPVMSVFMWGVNHSINDLNQVPVPVMLLPDDFKANTKIKVNNHLFNKENLPGHFKFKEYCPQVFRNLRERFGIEDLDYQVSLTRSPPLRSVDDQGEGLLLNSYDRTLVIKQISSEDHIVKCHGSTLLPQFLGMYRVSVDSEETYLIVMRNMFSHRLIVHSKLFLQGSLVAREASDKERGKELPTYKDMDFRNNLQKVYVTDEQKEKFMEKLNRDVEVHGTPQCCCTPLPHSGSISPSGMHHSCDAILAAGWMDIMDYSLLLGIHDVGRAERDEEEGEEVSNEEEAEAENGLAPGATAGSYGTSPEGIAGYMSCCKPLGPGEFDPYVDVYAVASCPGAPHKEVYFMGLIDVLTQYDTKKKAAHAAKTVKHGVSSTREVEGCRCTCTEAKRLMLGNAGAEISTVHPEQYAKRFRDFISNIFA